MLYSGNRLSLWKRVKTKRILPLFQLIYIVCIIIFHCLLRTTIGVATMSVTVIITQLETTLVTNIKW